MRIPIACSLEANDASARIATWQDVIGRSCTDRKAVAGGVRLEFDADAEADVTALAEAERACCGWARWDVVALDGQVVLTATADEPDGAATLRGLFEL